MDNRDALYGPLVAQEGRLDGIAGRIAGVASAALRRHGTEGAPVTAYVVARTMRDVAAAMDAVYGATRAGVLRGELAGMIAADVAATRATVYERATADVRRRLRAARADDVLVAMDDEARGVARPPRSKPAGSVLAKLRDA